VNVEGDFCCFTYFAASSRLAIWQPAQAAPFNDETQECIFASGQRFRVLLHHAHNNKHLTARLLLDDCTFPPNPTAVKHKKATGITSGFFVFNRSCFKNQPCIKG